MSFPTANRGEARRAYINALRAADGLPPLPERPETTWRSVEPVAVGLTSARPHVLAAAPEAAQGAVVRFFLCYSYVHVVYCCVRYCGVLTYLFSCTVLRCTYVLIFMYCKDVMCGNNNFYCSTHPSLTHYFEKIVIQFFCFRVVLTPQSTSRSPSALSPGQRLCWGWPPSVFLWLGAWPEV